MNRKKFLTIGISGVLIVYAMGIFLSHFAGSTGTGSHYTEKYGDRGWVASEPMPVGLDFLSNLRVLWRLSGIVSPVGTQIFIFSKSPLKDSLVQMIEAGEIDKIPSDPPTSENSFQQTIAIQRVGLPFQSFRSRVDIVKGPNGETKLIHHGALGISGKYIPGLESWRTLSVPLMPIFPGFIVDVLFWGLFAWGMEYVIKGALFVLKFVLGIHKKQLRAARRVNNQCITCGYPRGDFDTCPECGSAVEPLAVSED